MFLKRLFAIGAIFGILSCTQNSKILQLEGRISIKGSANHTYMSIRDKKTNKSYKIINKEYFKLLDKQNQIIKVKAKLIKESIAPGFPAVVEVMKVTVI